jgi:hypothetical protein
MLEMVGFVRAAYTRQRACKYVEVYKASSFKVLAKCSPLQRLVSGVCNDSVFQGHTDVCCACTLVFCIFGHASVVA